MNILIVCLKVFVAIFSGALSIVFMIIVLYKGSDLFGRCKTCGSRLTYKETRECMNSTDNADYALIFRERLRICLRCKRCELIWRKCRRYILSPE